MADESKNPQQIIDDATNALGQAVPLEPPSTTPKPPKKKGGKGMLIGMLIFLILTLPVAIYYGTQKVTEIRSRAGACARYGEIPTATVKCCSGLTTTLSGTYCSVWGSKCPSGALAPDGDICTCPDKPSRCNVTGGCTDGTRQDCTVPTTNCHGTQLCSSGTLGTCEDDPNDNCPNAITPTPGTVIDNKCDDLERSAVAGSKRCCIQNGQPGFQTCVYGQNTATLNWSICEPNPPAELNCPTGSPMYYCKTDTHNCIQTSDSYTNTSSCATNVYLYGQKPNSGTCYTSLSSCNSACSSSVAATPTQPTTRTPDGTWHNCDYLNNTGSTGPVASGCDSSNCGGQPCGQFTFKCGVYCLAASCGASACYQETQPPTQTTPCNKCSANFGCQRAIWTNNGATCSPVDPVGGWTAISRPVDCSCPAVSNDVLAANPGNSSNDACSSCAPSGQRMWVCNTSTYQCTQTLSAYTSITACEMGND